MFHMKQLEHNIRPGEISGSGAPTSHGPELGQYQNRVAGFGSFMGSGSNGALVGLTSVS